MKNRLPELTSQLHIYQVDKQSKPRLWISAILRNTMLITGRSLRTQATIQFWWLTSTTLWKKRRAQEYILNATNLYMVPEMALEAEPQNFTLLPLEIIRLASQSFVQTQKAILLIWTHLDLNQSTKTHKYSLALEEPLELPSIATSQGQNSSQSGTWAHSMMRIRRKLWVVSHGDTSIWEHSKLVKRLTA